jgi:hypothetical protein
MAPAAGPVRRRRQQENAQDDEQDLFERAGVGAQVRPVRRFHTKRRSNIVVCSGSYEIGMTERQVLTADRRYATERGTGGVYSVRDA